MPRNTPMFALRELAMNADDADLVCSRNSPTTITTTLASIPTITASAPRSSTATNFPASWISPEVNVRHTWWDRFTAVVGADARFNARQHILNYDEDPYALYRDFGARQHNFGIYAQGDLAIRDDLNLVAGLRYDYFQGVGGSQNPRAGLIWAPAKNTTLKFLYGEAFRAPNRYEQTFNSPGELKPEKVRTYEIVADQNILKNYRATVSLYRFEVDNILSQQLDPASSSGFRFANFSGITGNGAEAEFEARFNHGILARASYAIQKSEDAAGMEISNSPRNMVKPA